MSNFPTELISQDYIRQQLNYNSETGEFFWRIHRAGRNLRLSADKQHIKGYKTIWINGTNFMAHTVAWFHVYGEWIPGLDHRDQNSASNRIGNLRPSTQSQNNINSSIVTSSTGYKGVTFRKKYGDYIARIKKDGKTHYLGLFSSAEEAHAAYVAHAKTLYNDFVPPLYNQ